MVTCRRTSPLSPTSPMYTHEDRVSLVDCATGPADLVPAVAPPQGPTDAASQSTFVAPATSHSPRSAPLVSRAKSTGSLPESLIVNSTPGCVVLIAAAEFSTSSR